MSLILLSSLGTVVQGWQTALLMTESLGFGREPLDLAHPALWLLFSVIHSMAYLVMCQLPQGTALRCSPQESATDQLPGTGRRLGVPQEMGRS